MPVSVDAFSSSGQSRASVNINSTECTFFNATISQDYINLCENEEQVVSVIINNDDEGKWFFFNSSSFYFDLPGSIYVGPNSSITEEVTVYSGCDSGIISPSIRVWAEGARSVYLPIVLNVKGCYNPILVAQQSSDIACACESLNYTFSLYNPGIRNVTYALIPSDGLVIHDGEVINSIELPSGGSAQLSVNYSVPCNNLGEVNLTLNATAITTCGKSAMSLINILVSSWSECETVSVSSPVNVNVNDSQVTVPVSVMNVGVRPTSYNIVVSGSAISNLLGISKSFVTLEPGTSEVVELVFDGANITGDYVTVQAFSTDNLASDETVIVFGDVGFDISYLLYYLLLPAGLVVVVIALLFRSNFFKKGKGTKSSDKDIKIKKAEVKK
jgi:hypothetical protein